MRGHRIRVAVSSVLALAFATLFCTSQAFAFVTCSSNGDCWKTDSKVRWPGVMLTYHDDKWWDEHKSEQRYRFREADDQHDWRRGYWANGEWHGG
jgi:hypothetical protein